MTEVLRTMRDRQQSLCLSSFCTIFTWTTAFVAPWELSFHNFLVLFSHSTQVFSPVYLNSACHF